MHVLGIESSCDETSAAVVKDGRQICSNEVISSLRLHSKYGGVIPEIASRMQLETITSVVDAAIVCARVKLKDIGLISVTNTPGLSGSLLVGVSFAKALSLARDIPLLGVNHLHAHFYAGFLKISGLCGTRKKGPANTPALPFVGLVVSGGHTSLFYVEDFDKIRLLGSTSDDACGEAFDKVAAILGIGYPGGPAIEQLAKKGTAGKIKFTCSNTANPLDFSFSGIKTAVLYRVRDKASVKNANKDKPADIAAAFQETVVDVLIKKSLLACKTKHVNDLVIGGGVAANSRLREKFRAQCLKNRINAYFPPKELCMDNAAMTAGLGYTLYKKGARSGLDLDLS